jgi:diphthamide biosynthesis protein 3
MIPPLPPTLLQSNPQFALLHKTLTTTLLAPDASTKATNTTYLPLEDQVTQHLTQDARQRILLQGLQDVAISDDDHDDEDTPMPALTLPAELRELVYMVSTALLTTPSLTLTPSQTEILNGNIQELTEQLPRLLTPLSHALIAQQAHLYALSTATSANKSAPAKLPNYTLHLQLLHTLTHLNELRTSLLNTSTTLSNQLTTLLTQQTSHLTTSLTHLSRHTHGVLSRHTLSRSNHDLTISSTLSAKTALLTLEARRATYSPPTQAALANYDTHLNLLIHELEARKRTLEDELRLYAECDGREGQTMGELARRYVEVIRETAEVNGDVERLGKEMGKGDKGTGRGWGGVDTGVGGNGNERKVSQRNWEIR